MIATIIIFSAEHSTRGFNEDPQFYSRAVRATNGQDIQVHGRRGKRDHMSRSYVDRCFGCCMLQLEGSDIRCGKKH